MIVAVLVGYLIGSLPSADAISRLRGYDLRASGSGNPGTANALRVAGRLTALLVLTVDLLKGSIAVLAGGAAAETGGAIAAGVAAVAGQVLNPWFGFKGGKGLGVTAGVTLVAWPPGLLIVIVVAAVVARLLRTAAGALGGLAAYLGASILWALRGWTTWWGVAPDDRLVWMTIGIVTITVPKFVADLRNARYISGD